MATTLPLIKYKESVWAVKTPQKNNKDMTKQILKLLVLVNTNVVNLKI
jgi:hypothetical protein